MTQYAKIYSDKTLKVYLNDTNSDQAYQEGESLKVCVKSKCLNNEKSLEWLKQNRSVEIQQNATFSDLNNYLKTYQEITNYKVMGSHISTAGGFFGLLLLPVTGMVMLARSRNSEQIPLQKKIDKDIQELVKKYNLRTTIDTETYQELSQKIHPQNVPGLKILDSSEINIGLNKPYAHYLLRTLFDDAQYGTLENIDQNLSKLAESSRLAEINLPASFSEDIIKLAIAQRTKYYLSKLSNQLNDSKINETTNSSDLAYDFREYARRLRESKLKPQEQQNIDLATFDNGIINDTKEEALNLVDKALEASNNDKHKTKLLEFKNYLTTQAH